MSDFVTLRHRDHGGTADFPADAANQWRAMGWLPLDETKEPEQVPARRKKEQE